MKQCIRLRGISDEIKGKVWEHDSVLRAGRLASLEIVLDDDSPARNRPEEHAATNEAMKLGRGTDWSGGEGTPYRGSGLREFLVGVCVRLRACCCVRRH